MLTSSPTPVALLGGAGKAGRPLVQAALAAGHHVRALLRHPDDFPFRHPRLTVVPGDARDPGALRQLLRGSHALLSTLGNPKGEPTPMLSTVTGLLLKALPEAGIRRYVAVTSLYDTGRPQPDAATAQAAAYMDQHYPKFMADRRLELALLSASGLDWTCARLPLVVEAPALGPARAQRDGLPGPTITSADLAQFLLAQLTSAQYWQRAPFVAN
ncbi:MAG: NAD(P)-dependent oxidoreductase [Janthinobacterium lividum]